MAECCCPPSSSCSTKSKLPTGVLALTGSLLCSSCCLVQLALNALSLGCGGFAVLEPAKPYFRALTAALLLHHLVNHGITKRSVAIVSLVTLVAASQDILALHNKGQLSLSQLHSVLEPLASYNLVPRSMLQRLKPAAGDSNHHHRPHQLLQLHVEGMKCEGCAGHLRATLMHLPGVANCTVDFASKLVNVSLQAGQLRAAQVLDAIASVDDSYVATVLDGMQAEEAAPSKST